MAKSPNYNSKKLNKQDLSAARAELKQFRHDISILKKKGLITKARYDARSVNPSKYLKSVIRKFSDVLAGHSKTVKISKNKIKDIKTKGYKVINSRAIIPVAGNEKVHASRGSFSVSIKNKDGSKISRRPWTGKKPKTIKELENYFMQIKLKEDEYIAFSLAGNRSRMIFASGAEAWEYMSKYESLQNTMDERIYIDQIEIYTVSRSAVWIDDSYYKERDAYRKFRRQERNRYLKSVGRMPDYEEHRIKEKLRRDTIKRGNPAVYEAKKAKDRARKAAKKGK